MITYNLFPLLAGPFCRWDEHFSHAAEMGFDWVYVNPIQKVGASGSLYSIADCYRFNPLLLDAASTAPPDQQVRQMVANAHRAGLKLMVDLVINHCAIDSPLTREHPEWFVHESDGRIANPSCASNGQRVVWRDLAQFNHLHTSDPEGLFRFCRSVVEYLLELGFDGFRCDAAYQVPQHFWRRLIHDIKCRHHSTCFVAETLGCAARQTRETAQAGFDYVFNSSKWWNFHDCWLLEQYNQIRDVAPSISFPESHDTPRLCAELNGNVDGLKQRYLFSALFSAGVMMPIGFEYGFRKSLHVIHTSPSDWECTGISLCAYVGRVNAIKKHHPAFQEDGPTNILHCHNPNILLMTKNSTRHREKALLILNKDHHNYQEFYTDRFHHFIQAGGPLRDVSPEYPLDQVREPFHYALRPGQGIVLVASAN